MQRCLLTYYNHAYTVIASETQWSAAIQKASTCRLADGFLDCHVGLRPPRNDEEEGFVHHKSGRNGSFNTREKNLLNSPHHFDLLTLLTS